MIKTDKIISFESYPVNVVLKMLLKDMTTGKNIIFATDSYSKINPRITEKTHISESMVRNLGNKLLQLRVAKSTEQQAERRRKNAEVFTPAWICNKMNNHCDKEWFGREKVFNVEKGKKWCPILEPIIFDGGRDWKQYVDSKRLEIACGEAPYIVSRYDASTGEEIDISNRIGILDRKLRVVNENTITEKEWIKWVFRAFQSVYAYEFQGDSLLIARINILLTFVDYMKYRWNREPDDFELKKIANIIVWNVWQMDGMTGTVPFGKEVDTQKKISYLAFEYEANLADKTDCIIYDWQDNKKITFLSVNGGA